MSEDTPKATGERSTTGGSAIGGTLYETAGDAEKAVHDHYLYWSGLLTETSLQLSFAVIAANWAVFGSVKEIQGLLFAKLSIACVLLGFVLAVVGALLMSELHRKRVEYAEQDPNRWTAEYEETKGKVDPWPYTSSIEGWGFFLRNAKTWLPVLAGLFFLVALLRR